MYMKTFTQSLIRTLTRVTHRGKEYSISLCRYVKPGIHLCNDEIIALYKVKNWSLSIHDLAYLDYLHNLRKFLEILYVENCRQILMTDIELVDTDKYLKKLDQSLQLRLVELSVDKTNIKLRTHIEKILENRKKVLMGIKPVKTVSIVALLCPNTVNIKDIERVPLNAKNILNISLEPIVEDMLARAILNFRTNKST